MHCSPWKSWELLFWLLHMGCFFPPLMSSSGVRDPIRLKWRDGPLESAYPGKARSMSLKSWHRGGLKRNLQQQLRGGHHGWGGRHESGVQRKTWTVVSCSVRVVWFRHSYRHSAGEASGLRGQGQLGGCQYRGDPPPPSHPASSMHMFCLDPRRAERGWLWLGEEGEWMPPKWIPWSL